MHVGNSLVDVVHGPSLGPSLDVMVTGKLQHLGNGGGRRSNGGSTIVDVAYNVSKLQCVVHGDLPMRKTKGEILGILSVSGAPTVTK